MFTLQFAQTRKARNSTFIPAMGESCRCLLKEGTSIIRPTFKIHLGQGGAPATLEILSKENYCYCANFNRYYYITNITSETAVIVYVQCEVDVLASFRDDILATPAFVMYSNSHFNGLVPDNRLPVLGTSREWVNTWNIPQFTDEGSFVLTAVTPTNTGDLGTAASIVLNGNMMSAISAKLYSDDFWDNIKNDFYRPEEAILACMWTPISFNYAIGEGATTIKIGKYDIYTSFNAKKTFEYTATAVFTVPYTPEHEGGNIGDYRNFEPYSKYLITLPGVGTIDIPMKLLAGESDTSSGTIMFDVEIGASPVSGDVTYFFKLHDVDGAGFNVKGNFGVEVPISRSVGRYGSILQSLGGAATGVMTGAAIGGLTGITMGATQFAAAVTSVGLESLQHNTNVVGTLGGWGVSSKYNKMLECKTICWNISDEPNAIRPTIGRPYFHHVDSLGECSGVVQCTGAYVKTWATDEELQMISQYVNSSTNYLYGGIIIE